MKGKIPADLHNQTLTEREFTSLLFRLTGHLYTFTVGTSMKWGETGTIQTKKNNDGTGFYQLMPDTLDDGFFDWYCIQREYQQFFESKENAVLHFVYYRLKWTKEGKPVIE